MTRSYVPGIGHLALASALVLALPTVAAAQRNGQPATDQLGQEDIWGNPTFVGGVTNGGPAGHSIW
ncbi:MAG: hypothetical protein QF463_09470 [Vicinamibacterales bacterium]|jgi:hypothetical protein|nr:hypothetical protein [Acidobacteriota bacterium]MDP6372086.1 hypothetical protein [Vicinamibacterales bacterium]MDP6609283.1 hypothetical protein [Vicinamibacterales bacterium]HAK55109.1 hypothetical protein [Acidobacteriota bacterium]|tara:strand:- start:4194 stop:4391 length:198 start_codon:yes stop_codon:yes gene_type:complete